MRLYTRCGPAVAERYGWALKHNLRMPYGAIGIANLEGVPCFVMLNTHLRATVDPEDIQKSLTTLATKGDDVEKLLAREGKQ